MVLIEAGDFLHRCERRYYYCIDFFDFQVRRIVYLATVMLIRKLLLFGTLIFESPTCRDGEILQSRMVESVCVTESQKE